MTASNHALTGAVIALVVKRPELAIPLAFLSHFASDALPHFGVDESEGVFVRNKSPMFRAVVCTDITLFVILSILLPFITRYSAAQVSALVVLACMVAAYLPDSIWAFRFVREHRTKQWKPVGRLTRLHQKIQLYETERGLHVEYIWASLMALAFGVLI